MTDSERIQELVDIVTELTKKVAALDARMALQQPQTVYHVHSWSQVAGYPYHAGGMAPYLPVTIWGGQSQTSGANGGGYAT